MCFPLFPVHFAARNAHGDLLPNPSTVATSSPATPCSPALPSTSRRSATQPRAHSHTRLPSSYPTPSPVQTWMHARARSSAGPAWPVGPGTAGHLAQGTEAFFFFFFSRFSKNPTGLNKNPMPNIFPPLILEYSVEFNSATCAFLCKCFTS